MKYLKTFEGYYDSSTGKIIDTGDFTIPSGGTPVEANDWTNPFLKWTPEEESDLKGFGALITGRWRAKFPKLHSSEDSSKSKLRGDAAFTGMTIIKDDPSNPQFDETIENTYTAIMYSDAGKKYPNGKDFDVWWVEPVTIPKEINFKKELLASNDWEEFKRLLKTWLK